MRRLLGVLIVMAIFLGCQSYFFDADPHHEISGSRGPFTDEGLNTFQARNFVNFGYWGVDEGDNLIKSPLYNGWLVTALQVVDSRTGLRIALTFTCLLLTLVLAWNSKLENIYALFIAIGGFQYHLFQFYHFTMTEVLIISTALGGIFMAVQYLEKLENQLPATKSLLISSACFAACFLLKVQYFYILAFPFIVVFVAFFKGNRKEVIKHFLMVSAFFLIFLLLFYSLWYKPLQSTFDKVWAHQGTSRFSAFNDLWLTFTNSGKYLLWNKFNLIFALTFLVSLPLGVFLFFKSNSSLLKNLLIVSFIWILLELHKPFIIFLPSRYALSLFAAQALWMAITIYGIWTSSSSLKLPISTVLSKVLVAVLLLPLSFEIIQNQHTLWTQKETRSQQIIDDFASMNFKNEAVVGVWATGLVWNKDAYVLPVWRDFMNDDNILEKRKPLLVITEEEERDSDGVFAKRGINLNVLADSTSSYQYGPYNLHGFFLSVRKK